MIGFDIDVTNVAKRAADALTGNSLIKMAKGFVDQPTEMLGGLADRYGFTAAGTALKTGRIDDLVSAVGEDAVGLLAKEGARQLNVAIDAAAGQLIGLLQALNGSDPPPAGDVLLILGAFPFMVGTAAHQSLKRTNEYRWAKQDRLLRTPARQFVGVGDERVDLDGYLLPHYTGGADSITVLRAAAARGEPQEMIDHFGMVYGRYVVESIQETGSELDAHGQPRRVDFTLSLSIYGEDALPLAGAAAAVAMAASGDEPLPSADATNQGTMEA
ncbi:phage tail protein [Castellaniella denitrificans]|uniref:phage tail protein n=1 Tax=Castellaniella denitrificans TaxID=56119 RepID=UPI0036111C17